MEQFGLIAIDPEGGPFFVVLIVFVVKFLKKDFGTVKGIWYTHVTTLYNNIFDNGGPLFNDQFRG